MTKVELIAAVANDANLTKKDAEAAVNSALNAITAALKDGDKVTLVGFGTFEVRERPGTRPAPSQPATGRFCMSERKNHASGQIFKGQPRHQAPHPRQ